MTDYVGTQLLDHFMTHDLDPESDLSAPQEYRSFFGDEICTRVIAMGDIYLNHNDLFYQYLGMENQISYWGCMETDIVICVDENLKMFITQPDTIIRERNIDGMDDHPVPDQLPAIPEEVPQV